MQGRSISSIRFKLPSNQQGHAHVKMHPALSVGLVDGLVPGIPLTVTVFGKVAAMPPAFRKHVQENQLPS
jgi:hypothetical protein